MIGNRPFPAMSPMRSPAGSVPFRYDPRASALFLALQVLPHGSAHAPSGAFQKGDHLQHVRAVPKLLSRSLHGLGHPVSRPEQHLIGLLEHPDTLAGESVTLEPN